MRTLHCLNHLNAVREIAGDVLELGVGCGATSLTLALWMVEMTPDKRLFACDTFSGLPVSEGVLNAGECDFGEAFPRAVRELPLGNVRIIRGLVEHTLPTRLADARFCFAWLDLDLYLPTSGAAEWLTDRITPGGIIGFHDYGFARCPGIAKVVDKELDENKFVRIHTADSCVFLRRMP